MIELSENETPMKKDLRLDNLSPKSQFSLGIGGGNIADSEHSDLSIGVGMGNLPLNNIIKTKNDEFAGKALDDGSNLKDILRSQLEGNDYVEAQEVEEEKIVLHQNHDSRFDCSFESDH